MTIIHTTILLLLAATISAWNVAIPSSRRTFAKSRYNPRTFRRERRLSTPPLWASAQEDDNIDDSELDEGSSTDFNVEKFLSTLESSVKNSVAVPNTPESARGVIADAIKGGIVEGELLQAVDIAVPGFVRADGPNHFDVVGAARMLRGVIDEVGEEFGGESVLFFANEDERRMVEKWVGGWSESESEGEGENEEEEFRKRLEMEFAKEENEVEKNPIRLASLAGSEDSNEPQSLGDSMSDIDDHLTSVLSSGRGDIKRVFVFSPDLPTNTLNLRRLMTVTDKLKLPLVIFNPEFDVSPPMEWRKSGVFSWAIKAFIVTLKQNSLNPFADKGGENVSGAANLPPKVVAMKQAFNSNWEIYCDMQQGAAGYEYIGSVEGTESGGGAKDVDIVTVVKNHWIFIDEGKRRKGLM